MAADLRMVPATLEHVAAMLPHVRAADVAELWAADRKTPEEALVRALRTATDTLAVVVGDEVIAIAGVSPASLLGGIGVPWMIGTDGIKRHARPFLRASRPRVAGWRTLYNHLVNYVDNRNTDAIRWLTWLGFTMGEPAPFGPDRLPFRRFEMRA